MFAGAARVGITPTGAVWMDGMIRGHKSEGVHDPLFARALVLSASPDVSRAVAVVSLDVVAVKTEDAALIRKQIVAATGIPTDHISLAATHTHSAPATVGYFNPAESDYVRELAGRVVEVVTLAAGTLEPAAVGHASGEEQTISHHRRLLDKRGRVIMNWEQYDPGTIVKRLGEIDCEVGVLKVVAATDPQKCLCILFNHAGHPNVMSGDNHLLSADYPGHATYLVEERFGGVGMFLNGAQGSVDVDGLANRNWAGVARAGAALADAVSDIANRIQPRPEAGLRAGSRRYAIPARRVTEEERTWASKILAKTGGAIAPMADGVGDDYRALLFHRLAEEGRAEFEIEQVCFAVDDCAFISFPGEIYADLGLEIKARSPFRRTYVIGLSNGDVGYIPTRQAIAEGGYAEETRLVDAAAGELIVEQSCALLQHIHDGPEDRG